MNYSVFIGLTLDGKIYMDEYMGVIEALIPPGSGQTAHAPCLLETDDGDLLAAWFCGSRNLANESCTGTKENRKK